MRKQKTKNEKQVKKSKEKSYISQKIYDSLPEEEKENYIPVNPKRERFPRFAIISFTFSGIMLIVYIISCINPKFADFFNLNIASFFRQLLSALSGIFPISLAEIMVILLPIIFGLIIFFIIKYRIATVKMAWMTTISLVSVLTFVLSLFALTLGTGYKGTPIADKLNLKQENISVSELHDSSVYLADKLSELSESIEYSDDGSSLMPYTFSEMNDKLILAYDKFQSDYDFIKNFNSRLKPVMLSELLSYTHITGMYSYFTGEANINISFPDYCIPYTSAHELAHQRGISREDEANMVAFLVCISSDDPYIQYSGYLNMYEYMANALYSSNKESYYDVVKHLNDKSIGELKAYNKFFEKYKDSTASHVSSAVNDTFLKVQGTEGEKSYGMVVDITVAYFKDKNIIK